MFKNLQVTLYELFGYFLPGIVALVGVCVLFWTLYLPATPLPLRRPIAETWLLMAVAAYFLGHLVHSIGNHIGHPEYDALDEARWEKLMPVQLLVEAKKKVATATQLAVKDINGMLLFSFCDESLSQGGQIGDREIYQYRSGFYKSAMVSLVLLSGALFLRLLIPGASLLIRCEIVTISRLQIMFPLVFCIAGVIVAYERFNWFGSHRARRAVLALLLK